MCLFPQSRAHDAWVFNKKNRFKKTPDQTPTTDPSKKLIMTEKLRQVLTTAKPNLNYTEAEIFINEVSKE